MQIQHVPVKQIVNRDREHEHKVVCRTVNVLIEKCVTDKKYVYNDHVSNDHHLHRMILVCEFYHEHHHHRSIVTMLTQLCDDVDQLKDTHSG